MLSFPRLRNKYKGPVNKIAYFGMLGDVAVIVGLYVLYKERQRRKELAKPQKLAQEMKNNL
jgi:hypothetical protein